MKLIIGNKNYSSWSLRPWLAMKHLKLDFEEERIALDQPDTKERIASHSSAGYVPILIDGGVKVWESMAIMEHLAEKYPQLWPDNPQAKAIARSVAMEMHASFASLRSEMPMNIRASGRRVIPSPAAKQDIERIISIWSSARQDWQGEGPWLFGRFSIADAMYAPVAARFRTYGVHLEQPAASFMECLFGAPTWREWCSAAEQEKEYIEREEVGRRSSG